MASSAFSRLAANINTAKNLETILPGGASMDEGGPYEVTVAAVDTSKLENENKLDVIFADADGKQHRESLFVTNTDGNEFSIGFRWLLAGCIPSDEALKTFFAAAATDLRVCEVFTGMKLRITLDYSRGIRAHALGNGKYVGMDPNEKDGDGRPIPQTQEHDTIKDVYAEVKGTGKKRAYLRLKACEASHKEANLQAFVAAVTALNKPA